MSRIDINNLQDIPNVGKSTENIFNTLGIYKPTQLIGRDPYILYNELCTITHKKYDPCVIDIFIATVRYMKGESPQKWWKFTAERKRKLGTN